MPVIAPVSRHRKTNLVLYIVVCVVLAAWCAYDGYINQSWIAEHANPDGTPQPYLTFNRQGPFYFGAAAALLAVYLAVIRNKKITAEEDKLVLAGGETIPFDAIEKVDKTYFKSKGFFVITYTNERGRQVRRKLSDRNYDNLGAVLELVIEKIS